MTGTPSAAAKTWGPFTGRQLTVLISMAFVTMIFVPPSAAWAVDTFSNVAIQDPVSGAKAAVDSSRRLQVNGSVSGSSVYALPRPPSTPWNATLTVNPSLFREFAGPSAAPINLTSISIGTSGTLVDLTLWAYSVPLAATTCGFDTYMGTVYRLAGNSGTVATSASFPTPLVVRPPAGRKACLYAFNNVDTAVILNASGYFGA